MGGAIQAVRTQLVKARRCWARVEKVLRSKNIFPCMCRYFLESYNTSGPDIWGQSFKSWAGFAEKARGVSYLVRISSGVADQAKEGSQRHLDVPGFDQRFMGMCPCEKTSSLKKLDSSILKRNSTERKLRVGQKSKSAHNLITT